MTYVVGVDCAAQHKNFGLALGRIESNGVHVLKVVAGMDDVGPVLDRWAGDFGPVIYALDAPLGWPALLGRSLHPHCAGDPIKASSHDLFRRTTDKFVRSEIGKQPLEVGADRIARAAVTTLRVMDQLRACSKLELPLLWNPAIPAKPGMIEVYPAATLIAHGLPVRGYKGKKPQHKVAREVLMKRLSSVMNLEVSREALTVTDHALDAVICLLAAADFARGCVHEPRAKERELVRKEGWIWFAKQGGPGVRD